MKNSQRKQQSQSGTKLGIEAQHQIDNSGEQTLEVDQNKELFFGEKKFRTGLGLLSILLLIFTIATETTITKEKAIEEVKNRISSSVDSGFQLEKDVTLDLEPNNHEIKGFEGPGNARMLVWDFRGDSGNEIQILVDGQVLREVHILNSNVAAYSVPIPSVVTIRGLKGTSAITYAVKFPDRKQTLFNTVPINGINQYKLVPKL